MSGPAPRHPSTTAERATDLVRRVEATGMIEPGRALVVMLSGGRDSVALLAIAVQLGARPVAIHVNYGLRGDESDGDERHCRELCYKLGVALTVHSAGEPPPSNTHAWARDVRYEAGNALAEREQASLAVGHTATDQLETVLYRLATSPGRRALLGMQARRDRVVRPLLAAAATRDETAAFCRERSMPWREDSANSDRTFARTRVREELLPALLAIDARAHDNVLQTAELLRAEGEVLDELVGQTLAGRDEIGRDELAALPPALARLILRTLAERATGESGARAAARLDDVLALPEGMLDVGGGARAEVTGGTVRVIRTPAS